MSPPALAGITVLDLSTVGPASRASRILADYGARVIKVGAVPRAGAVQITPPYYAYSANRGMKRIEIDLKAEEGRKVFLGLAATADAVLESFRPGVAARLGVGYDDLRSVRADIVYCSTSGYGQTGPASQWAGHDVNYLGMGGYLECSERAPGDKPPLPGATIADAAGGGMQAAMAIMAALLGRATSGEGAHLDVSIADGVLSIMALAIDEYLATGTVPGPGHNILTGRYACYDTYRCADDRWVAVGAIEPAFYRNLCRLLGCEQWADHQLDDDAQDKIRADFSTAFASRPRDEWVGELAPADTCVSPVYSVPELVDAPHVKERGLVVDAVHATEGAFPQLRPLLAGSDPGPLEQHVRSMSSTDTDELLSALGITTDEVDVLRSEGVVA